MKGANIAAFKVPELEPPDAAKLFRKQFETKERKWEEAWEEAWREWAVWVVCMAI